MAAAGLVAALTLVSRVAGLGRWFVFSHGVGATCVGQVYATANQVPNVLYEVAAGGALAAVAVPLISARLNRGDHDGADQVAAAMLTWAVALLLPLAVVVALASTPLTRALLGEHACGARAVPAGALMLVVFAPQVVLYGLGIVLSGVLQAHRRFLAAAVAPLLSSLVVIATYLVYRARVAPGTDLSATPREALLVLAGGTTLGVVALSVPLLVPAWRAGVRLRPTWRFPPGVAHRARSLAVAGLVAVAAQQLAVLVTVWLTNRAEGVGLLNAYTYTQTVYLLPYAVLVVPLAVVAFPRLTDERHAVPVLWRTLQAVLVAGLAGAVALVAVRREVGRVFLALDAGADGQGREALLALPSGLAWFAPGLVGFAATALLSRALYARGSALAAGGAVALGWCLAAGIPLALLGPGGATKPAHTLAVLGGASSLGMTVSAGLLLWLVHRTWGTAVLPGVWRTAGLAAAGALAVLAVRELLVPGTSDHWLPAAGLGLLSSLAVVVGAVCAVRVGDPTTYRAVVGGVLRRGED